MYLYRPIYDSVEAFDVYIHIMSRFDVRLCVGLFVQDFFTSTQITYCTYIDMMTGKESK